MPPTDPNEYEKAVPLIRAHLAKLERAVDRTRALYSGQPYDVVRPALVEALGEEDVQNADPQVVDELARQISEGRQEPKATSPAPSRPPKPIDPPPSQATNPRTSSPANRTNPSGSGSSPVG
ncbi:hypothetical protein GCM10017771_28840 [Streptomyces capitiformicae]|uniref:Uncharacterized protein n=1 Tax=Streptomyces capitiformicae TaxID=2014920 RepID=A0A919GNL3_9ACTN|nr:hypothetical protein GCM10017771_28840 [Streptomyces capitiformicae]